jgi:hypothetical protein
LAAGTWTDTAPLVRMPTQRTLRRGWSVSIAIRKARSAGSPEASRANPSERNTTAPNAATSMRPSTTELRSRASPAPNVLLRSLSTNVIQPSTLAAAQRAALPALAFALGHTTTRRLRLTASIRAVCRLATSSLALAASWLPLTKDWKPGTPKASTIAATAIATISSTSVNPPTGVFTSVPHVPGATLGRQAVQFKPRTVARA